MSDGSKRSPADFLKMVVGRPVVVKLNWASATATSSLAWTGL